MSRARAPVAPDETPARTDHTLLLVASAAAEPHVLAEWSEQTQHPGLQDAYRVLQHRVTPRAAHLATLLVETTDTPRAAVTEQVQHITTQAATTTFEPSRLKWLIAARRDRLDHESLPGYEEHREAEQEEADRLEDLLHSVLRTMC